MKENDQLLYLNFMFIKNKCNSMKLTNNVQFLGESLTRVGIAQLDYEGKLQFMIYIYICSPTRYTKFFNPLKPSGFFTYHQVQHSKILHCALLR